MHVRRFGGGSLATDNLTIENHLGDRKTWWCVSKPNQQCTCTIITPSFRHQDTSIFSLSAVFQISIITEVAETRFPARSKDQEILEEGGGAGPSRDHESGGGAGLRKLDFFCFELSKLFVNSSAMDIVFVTLSKHSS